MTLHLARLIAGALAFLSPGVFAADYQRSKTLDPFAFCERVEKRFPATIEGIRKLDRLQSESVRPDRDYCYADPSGCEIRSLSFPGLEGSFLVKKKSRNAIVLTITFSSPRWKTLDPVKVGAPVDSIEEYFGVRGVPGANTLKIIGACTPLDIDHAEGRVTRVHLDCQACM